MRFLKEEKSPWELISLVDADLNEFIVSLKSLVDDGLAEIRDGKIALTPAGLKERDKLKLKIYNVRCEKCDGRGFVSEPFGILNEFKRIVKDRPRPTLHYDQGHIKEEDLMRRIAFIYERGDLENGNIVVVGDDDLISIGMALTGLPKRVEVLEIDERIINFINEKAKKYGFDIHAQKFDIRNNLSEKLHGKFDVFITDPVETIEGITLFLSRAATALKGVGSAGYFGLTHLEASLKKWHEIERRLLSMNFVITDILRDFNVYPMHENLEISVEKFPIYSKISSLTGYTNADTDFYRSSLIRIEAIDKIKPLISENVELKDEIYVDDESLATALAMGRVK